MGASPLRRSRDPFPFSFTARFLMEENMRWLFLVCLFALVACGDDKETGEPEADTDTDTDTDMDTDADADSDTDTDTDADTDFTLTVESSLESLTTRQTVNFTLIATYSSGSETDVTNEATFTSDDPSILLLQDNEGQPLDEGSVAVSGAWGGEEASLDLTINLSAPTEGDLVFNEILADATVDGDPNGDGETDRVQDEFVEIANASGVAVDLSGLMIAESWYQVYNPRHTFAEGSKLKAGEAIVVFGGGDVSNLSEENVQFLVVENADPGEEYGLALDDDGDTVYLYAADETTILASVSFGFASPDGSVPAATDESIVLSPDVTGSEYVAHSDASGSSMYSPGTYADGSGFPGVDGVFGE